MSRMSPGLARYLAKRLLGNRLLGALATGAALVLAVLGILAPGGPGEAPRPSPEKKEAAYALAGRVVHVADGDTFTLLAGGRRERIRLASIDAPETGKDDQRPGQPMARASKAALSRLVSGKTLNLSCFEHDHYGRNVCDVPLPGGSTANREMVAMGLAWANMEGRGKYMRDPRIPVLEEQARRDREGIWRDAAPVRPWVWRYQCWRRGHC